MVEIILRRVSGAMSPEKVGDSTADEFDTLQGVIFAVIPAEGVTPEEVFGMMIADEEFNRGLSAPRQFFLAILALLDRGFITASTQMTARA